MKFGKCLSGKSKNFCGVIHNLFILGPKEVKWHPLSFPCMRRKLALKSSFLPVKGEVTHFSKGGGRNRSRREKEKNK